jgi:sterol desaturase/sphingolipid hydroxylase (fatty acid hydroxylase superfamily)
MVLVPKLLELLVPPMVLATTVWAIGEGGVWPSNWPLVLQLALALIISQFGEYWAHRLMHTVPLLWRLHAVHHSPRRLYFLNAARFHPLDTAASFTLALAPLVALGAGPDLMLQFSVWVAVHGMFQHCNIRVRLGPLNWVFSMAELHRWHHSLKLEEANANYGNNILFWDVVFGTVHWPADREASAQIGLGGMPNFPTSYLGQMLAPWRWEAASAPQEGHRAPDA